MSASVWEKVDELTNRLKVPGGWLVVTTVLVPREMAMDPVGVAMVFLPDLNHEWEIEVKSK